MERLVPNDISSLKKIKKHICRSIEGSISCGVVDNCDNISSSECTAGLCIFGDGEGWAGDLAIQDLVNLKIITKAEALELTLDTF